MSSEKNLEFWNKLKSVPKEVKKTIKAGRLKGMTDIKPQWRLEVMTAVFGPIGIGWYYKILDKAITETSKGETVVSIDLDLFIKHDNEWSKPIFGTGGSKMVQHEKNGVYINDEAFKMALTDALSVAMKQIGVGSDVYMGYSESKYTESKATPIPNVKPELIPNTIAWDGAVQHLKNGTVTIEAIEKKYSLKLHKDELIAATV